MNEIILMLPAEVKKLIEDEPNKRHIFEISLENGNAYIVGVSIGRDKTVFGDKDSVDYMTGTLMTNPR